MFDYLLIGFGLGGLHLAHILEENDKTFVVLNDDSQKASRVAGGLCNPVILNKFSLVWNGEQNMQIADETYRTLEKKLGLQVHFEMPIHRKIDSKKEQLKWLSVSKEQRLAKFLNPNLIPEHQHIPSNYQFGEVMRSKIIRIPELLDSYVEYLTKKKKYISTSFEHSALEIKKEHLIYKNLQAKKIIFCEGFGLKQNIFFNYLPLSGNKGEYLIILAPKLKLMETIKSSFFLIPLGNDHYKFGATYEREFENQLPTESTKKRLTSALEELIDYPYSIVDQVAGVRPITPDRQPLIGQHPEYHQMFICNGFGSRGILNAPTMAKELMAYMEQGTPISPEINIARFRKKWFKR